MPKKLSPPHGGGWNPKNTAVTANAGTSPVHLKLPNEKHMPKKLDPPPGEEKPKGKSYIKLPEDYEPVLDDENTFEAVVRIKREDGKYCVIEIDNIPLNQESEDDEIEEDDDYDLGKNVMRG